MTIIDDLHFESYGFYKGHFSFEKKSTSLEVDKNATWSRCAGKHPCLSASMRFCMELYPGHGAVHSLNGMFALGFTGYCINLLM